MTIRGRWPTAVVLSTAFAVLSTTACTNPADPPDQPTAGTPEVSAPSAPAQPHEGATPSSPGRSSADDPALSWVGGDAIDATRIDLDSATLVGTSSVEIVSRTPVGTLGSERLNPLALLPDGSLVVVQVPADQYDGGEWLTNPSVVGVWNGQVFDPYAETTKLLNDPHPRQAYAAASDGVVVAWVETTSTDLYQSMWRIFAHDGSGQNWLVSKAEQINSAGLPIVDGDTKPVVHAGRVYWATSFPARAGEQVGAGGAWRMEVVSAPADGSDALRIEVVDASRPTAGDAGVYVARALPGSPFVPGRFGLVTLIDGDDVHDVLRTAPGWQGHIAAIAAGSELLVATLVTAADEVQVAVVDMQTNDAVIVPLHSKVQPAVAVCGNRVVWTSADFSGMSSEPVYVLDTTSGALAAIQVDGNYGPVYCAGPFVSWSEIGTAPGSLAHGVVARWP